jgi:hypothetical protein
MGFKIHEIHKDPVSLNSQVVINESSEALRQAPGLTGGQAYAPELNKNQRIGRVSKQHYLIVGTASHDETLWLVQVFGNQVGQIPQQLFFLILTKLHIGLKVDIGHDKTF